jgi:hypothetical protein
MFPTPMKIALTAAFLAAASGLATAYDSPTQRAWDQAACDARFFGQDFDKTRQARKDCVHRERLARKDQADRAALYAKDQADRAALYAKDRADRARYR